MDCAVKDMFLNVNDKLKDAINYLETDCYIKEGDKYFEEALRLYDTIWELSNEIDKLVEASGSTPKKCSRGYEIKPHKSAAGWYMGTHDNDGLPMCRLSSEYADSEEDAWALPLDRGYAMEIKFCNGGKGCLNISGNTPEGIY